MTSRWWLYLLRTENGSLYTGVTVDVERRFLQHAGERPGGARHFRATRPVLMAYRVEVGDKRLAMRCEYRIKRLPKSRKEALVSLQPALAELLDYLGLDIGRPEAAG
ncbi:GIY-YIG nuclease family protein [Marinobacteraceae bacterium S3BR75-40.1]